MADKGEDPLHRLSRTPTKASRQQQWEVWKEAERQRIQPIKEWGKSPTRIHHHHTPPRTAKSAPSTPSSKTSFAAPPRTTTTVTSRTSTSKSTTSTPKTKTAQSSPKNSDKVEKPESKHALSGAKMTKKHDGKKKQSIESIAPPAASVSATSTATPSEPVKTTVSEVKPALSPKKLSTETASKVGGTKSKESIESTTSTPTVTASTSTATPTTATASTKSQEPSVKASTPIKATADAETKQATEKKPIESTSSTTTTTPRSSIPDAVKDMHIPDKTTAMKLFDKLDENASGKLSLAELDKGIVTLFPDWNNKPAIMAAYKAADRSNNGFVERKEFGYFLQYIVYYNNLWSLFAAVDTDGDRRIAKDEFIAAFDKLQLAPPRHAQDVFDEIDVNGGGMILFDELIHWMATTNSTWGSEEMEGTLGKTNDDAERVTKKAATTSAPPAPEPPIPKAVKEISIPGKEKGMQVFDELDENASGKLSLAELDKGIVTLFPEMNNKPAIMAAYKAADRSNNGFVERKEFGYFLRYIVYYNNLWSLFSSLDDDNDRRITLDEFTDATDLLALPRDAQDIFHEIDVNGGGMILFQEFVDWMATNEEKFELSDKRDIHTIQKQLDALASS